ncbi:MAG TPA: 3-oxoacyl-[acyl-carrier-protein] synthase III C-terminal domain-containing protein [Polyangiaceae bacterium]|nr:3-oxoacyl-[acyl-carrier-protein] synthase III C-terminal domain-containing protein [Polyangiaceae bacterium]
MTIDSVGIRAVAVHFPRGVRTNRFWYNHHPEIVAAVEAKKKQRIWAAPERKPDDAADPNDTFDAEMAAYLNDPFRGTIERRVLAPGESSLTLETTVAKKAMAAAQLEPKDIDLLIVSSFLPDHFGCMDAPYVARDLGLRGMAFNLESACASAMVGLQTACGLVKSGQYRNVLVVASCTYSRDTDTRDTISWTSGDGAGAFVVSEVEKGYGRLGGKGIHTGGTCGKLWFENYARDDGTLWFRLLSSPDAGKALRDTAAEFLLECCHGALRDAGVTLNDIDHFVFNTPVAWYSKFCARTLGIDPERPIVNTYPKYANCGPALLTSNLYHAAREMPFKKGDLVLMYSVGSISSAGAIVVRWGDVALGPEPEPPEIVCD